MVEDAYVSYDILTIRKYNDNNHAIDIAFPVIAIECELTPPIQNHLMSLEKVILQLISCRFSIKSIADKMHLTEPIIQRICSTLLEKDYIEWKSTSTSEEHSGYYEITKDGENYLAGENEERVSSKKKYGWMFYSPIVKVVFPFFWEGNIDKIRLWDNPYNSSNPMKKLLDKSEKETFQNSKSIKIQRTTLKKAYKLLFKLQKLEEDCKEENIPPQRKAELFANLFSFDEKEEPEEEIEERKNESPNSPLSSRMFIRQMKESRNCYLHMRIIIDLSSPGGYIVESPFRFVYDEFFKKYIQIFMKQPSIVLEKQQLKEFLHSEIRKLCPEYKDKDKSFDAFIMDRIPELFRCKSRFATMHENLSEIYFFIQRESVQRDSGLIYKSSIVSRFSSNVLEHLFDAYFKCMHRKKIEDIQQSVFDAIRYPKRYDKYLKRICTSLGLSEEKIRNEVKYEAFKKILGRMTFTYGNSMREKFINMLVIYDYYNNDYEHKYLHNFFSKIPDIEETYDRIMKLNEIRNKVAHNSKFTEKDYDDYMNHVYPMIRELLAPFSEEKHG